MNNYSKVGGRTLVVAAVLLLCGVIGYASNPAKAISALISGGAGFVILGYLGWMVKSGHRWALKTALFFAALAAMLFGVRAGMSWKKVLDGDHEKILAASLITVMTLACLLLVPVLINAFRLPPPSDKE